MADRVSPGGIVVGVDGSPGSDVAVQWAAAAAVMRKTALTVVHVLHFPTEDWSGCAVTTAPLPEDFFLWQEQEGRRIVANAIRVAEEATAGTTKMPIQSEIFHAPPAPTLVDLSKDAQMMVVGCRGQEALQRALLGSVSTALVHRAHCPVAIIHNEIALDLRSDAPVLVGIDGSPASELATSMAFDEASWRGVDLVALHAWTDAVWPGHSGVDWSAIAASAEETLAERLAGWQERYPDVAVRRVVVADHAARHLLKQSEASQLVVVGSHGRGGLADLLLGSVSTAVVHGARTPVIVARKC